jgi:hypothetical protein
MCPGHSKSLIDQPTLSAKYKACTRLHIGVLHILKFIYDQFFWPKNALAGASVGQNF